MKISYNWLKSYIPNIPEAEKVADLITFHVCEIEDIEKLPSGDSIFDLKVLPDRAHDLLSHRGVAKEIAGLLGLESQLYEVNFERSSDQLTRPSQNLLHEAGNLKIEIQSPNCRRYMGRIVRNIKVEKSPEWMAKRLESIGQRSINNIVDITNFVLFDCGQPTHVFDLDKLTSPKIIVREAKVGEKITTLDKKDFDLTESDLIIADEQNSLAIAGVKGGKKAEVDENTKNIVIEVANFDPVSVRKTAQRLGIFTDALKRFENDLPQVLCEKAIREISNLILEVCPGATFEDVVDNYPVEQEGRKTSFSGEYISKMLGVKIPDSEIENILKNYQYKFIKIENGWEVEIPEMRLDMSGPHDMAEEIGRIYGYDKVIPQLPKLKNDMPDDLTWQKIYLAKQKLIKDGYSEVMTYTFGDKGDLEVLSSASDKKFLRTNLTDGIKESFVLNDRNLPLLDVDSIRIFEIGTIFLKDKEEMRVAYSDKKGITEVTLDEFMRKIETEPEDKFSGPRSNSPDTENLSSGSVLQGSNNKFKMWSVYPFIARDIAVWVPKDTNPDELVKIYKENGGDLLIREPKMFDKFTKENKTSYAYRLVFQSYEKTLTDDEINEIISKIGEKISSFGWEIR